MSLGLTPEERKTILLRKVVLWLIGVACVPAVYILMVIDLFPRYPEFVSTGTFAITMMMLISLAWAVLFALAAFFDWFPDAYYDDLRECPECNTKNLKLVHEALCFNCGHSLDFKVGPVEAEN